MTMTQRYAGMLRRHAGELDKLEKPIQAECARQAARHMEDRERALAAEIQRLRQALRFYANGRHYQIDEDEDFDTVSGEPQNWLFSGLPDSTTSIERGGVAEMALKGVDIAWLDVDAEIGGDGTPQPIEGEVSCVG